MEQFHLGLVIAGAFVGWTTSVIVATYWLAQRFRALEVMFHKALNNHKEEDADTFGAIDKKIQRIELKLFGWTKTS